MPRRRDKLDKIDLKILDAVMKNGRISKQDLAERVHLSPSPCAERLARLEELGYITGYTALIDISAILDPVHVTILFSLESHQAEDFVNFEAAMQAADEIISCEAAAGDIDYIAHFVGRDLRHYQEFMENLLAVDVKIKKYFGYVRSKPVKDGRCPPLARLAEWAGEA